MGFPRHCASTPTRQTETTNQPTLLVPFVPLRRLCLGGLIVEPVLTHAWHEATWRCCAHGGRVIDIGGNYGWFTLFSAALGCSVDVFEPVPAYKEALRLGLALNEGFAPRVDVHAHLVHDGPPGQKFTLVVPEPLASLHTLPTRVSSQPYDVATVQSFIEQTLAARGVA